MRLWRAFHWATASYRNSAAAVVMRYLRIVSKIYYHEGEKENLPWIATLVDILRVSANGRTGVGGYSRINRVNLSE